MFHGGWCDYVVRPLVLPATLRNDIGFQWVMLQVCWVRHCKSLPSKGSDRPNMSRLVKALKAAHYEYGARQGVRGWYARRL